jgi:hypothetical protein
VIDDRPRRRRRGARTVRNAITATESRRSVVARDDGARERRRDRDDDDADVPSKRAREDASGTRASRVGVGEREAVEERGDDDARGVGAVVRVRARRAPNADRDDVCGRADVVSS